MNNDIPKILYDGKGAAHNIESVGQPIGQYQLNTIKAGLTAPCINRDLEKGEFVFDIPLRGSLTLYAQPPQR